MTTSGYPTTALSESGVLPTGMSFVDNGNGTGTLSGTPAAGTSGTYPVTFGATNGVSPDATQSFTLTVDVAPAFTSGAATTFTTGSSGAFTVSTSANPTAAVSETGTLPSGVSFSDNGDGTATLAGTPAAGTGGSYPFTITAANGVIPNATQAFTLTVDQAPAVTSSPATTFVEGAAGSFTVRTSGNPDAALSETGALPSGVGFTDNGDGTATLSGTPGAATRGTYPITVMATNGVSPDASQSFSLTVDAAPTITSADTTTFTAGSSGTFTVSTAGNPDRGAVGDRRPAERRHASATTVTARPRCRVPGGGDGGDYLHGQGGQRREPQRHTGLHPHRRPGPGRTSTASTTFTPGVSSSFEVTVGQPDPALSESGSLPSGVTFSDNGNGTASLAGTPTAGAGNYPIAITAENGIGHRTHQTLHPRRWHRRPPSPPNRARPSPWGRRGLQGVGHGQPTPGLTETGTLPAGVTFTDNGDGTATLAGTPTANGTYPITVTATNGVSPDATQIVHLDRGPGPGHHLVERHGVRRGVGGHVLDHVGRLSHTRAVEDGDPAERGQLHRQR